jgi:hypothetical protein
MSDTISPDDPRALLGEYDAIQAIVAEEAKARRAQEEEKSRRSAAVGKLHDAVYSLISDINQAWVGNPTHRPNWDYHLPRLAAAIVGACQAWREEGRPDTLFDAGPPAWWDSPRTYAQTVFRAAMHGEGEGKVEERLRAAADGDRRELWQWFRDLPQEFLNPPPLEIIGQPTVSDDQSAPPRDGEPLTAKAKLTGGRDWEALVRTLREKFPRLQNLDRDIYWLRLKEEEELSPAKIRDRSLREHPNWPISPNNSGAEVVESALKRLTKAIEKSASS